MIKFGEINNVEVGDVILTKDKRLFLVTNITLPFTKNEFNKEGKKINSMNFGAELHLFNVEDKKNIISAYDRLIENNELWADVEVEKIIKHNDYSLKINM